VTNRGPCQTARLYCFTVDTRSRQLINRRLANKPGLPALLAVSILLAMMPACGSGTSASTNTNPPPEIPLTRLSTDTFTNASSQHATEVEPGTFAFGSTIVSAFQVGRIFSGGGADIGFSTSTDGGTTWTSGFLPGITTFQSGGTSTAASDASVAFDAAHNVWIIASLAFAFYVANFSHYNKTYGSLGGIIAFLIWLWISNVAVLFGAQLNAELERGRQLEAGEPAEDELLVTPRMEKKK